MDNERALTIETFSNAFGDRKDESIVIYGIGKNTEYLLEHFTEHKIVALMDGTRRDGEIYGKPIISEDELLKMGIKTIVIIATAMSAKIVYGRIASFCEENEIDVYDINGDKFRKNDNEHKDLSEYAEINKNALLVKIARADVVSFDIFDTLIMRTVFYPRDIYLLCEKEIQRTGLVKRGFFDARVRAERRLYARGGKHTLDDIYERLREDLALSDDIATACKNIETKTEKQYMVRREEVYNVFCDTVKSGKTVILTSDMYLTEDMMREMLNSLGFALDNVEVFVSCDYGVTKYDGGLFRVLRDRYPGSKILHIGDNAESDGVRARENGIDDTFLFHSAAAMLSDSYASELLKYDGSLSNRIIIGEFIAKQLNNPFLFSETHGKFSICNNYETAYSFVAPFIYSFILWMIKKSRELELDYLLFASRDGYLLYEIYQEYRQQNPDAPKAAYFYTSRAVAAIVSFRNDDDIKHFTAYPFDGTVEELLKIRFRLSDDEIMTTLAEETAEAYVLRHREAILKHSESVRKRYMRYLDDLDIPSGSKVGFVDFVATGTCQYAIEKITDWDLQGLYFARIRRSSYDIDVHARYGTTGIFSEKYKFLDDFLFVENILTSREATLMDFDESGKPVFDEEYRTSCELAYVENTHNAVKDYVEHTKLDVADGFNIDKELTDFLVHCVDSKYSVMAKDCFLPERRENMFSNRMYMKSETGDFRNA